MKVLITGGNGQLGQELQHLLDELGFRKIHSNYFRIYFFRKYFFMELFEKISM
ncbi:sugar nucleotide-binding protein [Liquorilactobacillus nagelii]|uniref:sugar nucleotide-binding protein n=1 Tax=Liquorilactobacillus nagelii TaxID=82688 RepID=UPI001E550292|nr:sugar nucleotide-binding protein [Liquorilactobacillus nagelii]